ncbi:MAG: hypothetical protein HOO96_13555, partial [Polyangiaceae bacterium]|nr:hypothetical protein [Polyangiaceae bacterium]
MNTSRIFRTSAVALALAALALGGLACGTLEKAAAKDPQRCERDPNCAKKRGKSSDCNTQCGDDPACVERCREIELGIG